MLNVAHIADIVAFYESLTDNYISEAMVASSECTYEELWQTSLTGLAVTTAPRGRERSRDILEPPPRYAAARSTRGKLY